MAAYGFEDYIEGDHFLVRPDTWVYLFEYEGKKYILITTDYLGDYDFDVFPHLLKFNGGRLEFVLQREIFAKDDLPDDIMINAALFEYTD